jgi:ankyrin repeat protein
MRGRPPLSFAAAYNHPRLLQRLIAAGADVNFQSPRKGRTSLQLAALHGHADCVTTLLALKADALASDEDCNDALFLATTRGNTACVQALLLDPAVTARVDCRNAWRDHAGGFEVLFAFTTLPYARQQMDNYRFTALEAAAFFAHPACAALLLAAGARARGVFFSPLWLCALGSTNTKSPNNSDIPYRRFIQPLPNRSNLSQGHNVSASTTTTCKTIATNAVGTLRPGCTECVWRLLHASYRTSQYLSANSTDKYLRANPACRIVNSSLPLFSWAGLSAAGWCHTHSIFIINLSKND